MSKTETTVRRIVRIPADGIELEGALEIPPDVRGLVVFAHGSGSSRMSPRNRYVAIQLRHAGFATLLLDLLTEREDLDRDQRFNIALLAARLQAAVEWTRTQPIVAPLPVGLFGASIEGYGWLTETFSGWVVVGVLVVSGALIGVGAKAAGGCTSGNGLCGSAILSPASLVATGTFFGTAILVSFVTEALL